MMAINKRSTSRILRIAGASAMLAAAHAAAAYTECPVTPVSIFAGDEGSAYITYSNGGVGAISSADPDFKQTFALVTAAILSDKQLDVRYAADGLSCTSTMQLIVGVRLNK